MPYLQIQGVVFKRGLEGKTCPKYVRRPSILYDAYRAGKKERKRIEKETKLKINDNDNKKG